MKLVRAILTIGILLPFCGLAAYSINAREIAPYMYLTDHLRGNFYQCSFNNNGSFANCTHHGLPWSNPKPSKMVFTSINKVGYAYVIDDLTNKIYRCSLNADGTLNTCAQLATPGHLLNLSGIAFASINGIQYVYITNAAGSQGDAATVYQCTLTRTGDLAGCINGTGGLSAWGSPTDIISTTIGSASYVYVVDYNYNISGAVIKCTLNSDGTFNTCQATADVWSTPSYIATTTIGSSSYVYVTQDDSDFPLYACEVNVTINPGTLFNCNAVTLTDEQFQPFTALDGISFGTMGDGAQYLYLASDGSTYQCALSSPMTGACTKMNPGTPSVTGLTFQKIPF